MKLFNNCIAIFVVKLLLLKMGKFHNAVLASEYNDTALSLNKMCNEIISYNMTYQVPYRESYKYYYDGNYKTKFRINYRLAYRIVKNIRRKCCEGYVEEDEVCVPRCPSSCVRGICLQPDVCVCKAGYRMSKDTNGNETCVPICANKCVNGACIEPNVCLCNEGYWMGPDGFTCYPACYDECVRNYGHCYEPNVCSCHSDYRRVNASSFICEPVCDRACTNGYCKAPNVCTCLLGYEAVNKSDPQSSCKPLCTEPCVFGTCVAPETCMCDDGYAFWEDSKHICKSICEYSHVMYVQKADICTCKTDYRYSLDIQEDPRCKLVCALDHVLCESSDKCIRPNCTCFDDYYIPRFLIDYTKHFFPWAVSQKKNTSIFLDDWNKEIISRIALHLYELEYMIIRNTVCIPYCETCLNGMCVAPYVCICYSGYHPKWIEFDYAVSENKLYCEEDTPSNCNMWCGSNGVCDTNGTCVCKSGYINVYTYETFFELQKHYSLQFTHFCTHEEFGSCMYKKALELVQMVDGVCLPLCERGCQNGDCVGPNHCICHDNFVPNNGSDFEMECIPAICNLNYSENDIYVTHNDYNCTCQFGWTGRDCNTPTVCVVTMDVDHSDSNRITVHKDINSTIIQAHNSLPHCHQFNESLTNESFCYVMPQSGEVKTTYSIGCLLPISTNLSCTTNCYKTLSKIVKMTWYFVIVFALICLAMATCLICHRRQKEEKIEGTSINVIFSGKPLLSENVYDDAQSEVTHDQNSSEPRYTEINVP